MDKLTADPHSGRVRWTREAFLKLTKADILGDGHYELLEGEIASFCPSEMFRLGLPSYSWLIDRRGR